MISEAAGRLALWGVLVLAGVFVVALLALCNVADWMFGGERPVEA